ncbi:putative expansin/Lol pI [Lupinus albus]|uniref:Expansin n=1 Tax=Lupinus albus TaxID=3870 RepID=A0A6A4QR66_LUPAL|nr:putative expansin/Lol pI [Lupinus albus]
MAMLYSFVPMAFFMALLVPAMSAGMGRKWHRATATFYGDINGGETMQGACGYGNLFNQGYGLETAALSTALFNNGLACGSCYEIKCVKDPQWCIKGAGTIKVTATNFCPPNYRDGSWCNPPQKHFDLSMKMFTTIALYRAGIVPVKYRRIPCIKTGGVKFELTGNPYWLQVLVYNVANAGDVYNVRIKGSRSTRDWNPMTHNWGEHWHTGLNLVGESLSFQVTTSDGKMMQFDNIVPTNWQFGQTYHSIHNF